MKPIITFTFDDGTADHYYSAAPVLEKYGYRGSFAIVSGFVGRPGYVTWSQVSDLHKRGHEISAHTATHANLESTWYLQGAVAVRKEIEDSVVAIERRAGFRPCFVTAPYNQNNPVVVRIIHQMGLELLNPDRPNFGANESSLGAYLNHSSRFAKRIIDLQLHGIESGGGWNSFGGVDAFERFVREIHDLEVAGKVTVCTYGAVHSCFVPSVLHACRDAVACFRYHIIDRPMIVLRNVTKKFRR